uniref:Uncharacterized protein n=1 Tax=Hucho hucho TaxID=62062 RepID=A0A4W5RTG6_9TELE
MHQGAPVDVRACEASSVVKVTIAVRMHLTRPKSSKGRCRPSLSHPPNVDMAASFHDTPLIPKPPSMGYNRSDRCLPPAITIMFLSYPLFPSLGTNTMRTRASSQSNPELGNVSEVLCKVCPTPNPLDLSVMATTPKTESPPVFPPGTPDPRSLLLAIRAPCGSRFEHHFLLTDTLLQRPRYGTRYEHDYIETVDGYIETGVDRPFRRTFTDLNMTLHQNCEITHGIM